MNSNEDPLFDDELLDFFRDVSPKTIDEIPRSCCRRCASNGSRTATSMSDQLQAFKWAGTISHGMLRGQDLLPAFLEVLLDLGADRFDREAIERERKAYLAFSGSYDKDPDYTPCDVQRELDNAQEFLDWLRVQLGELAPEGYYFGTLEDDASDYGFWPIEVPTVTAGELDRLIDPYLRAKATES